MLKLFYLIGGYLTADLLKKVLFGAGIGVASYAFFNSLINMYIDRAINNLGGIPASAIQLLGLFGLDKALSVIIGALVIRASINAMQIGLSVK